MNAKEHNEAVKAQLEKILSAKVAQAMPESPGLPQTHTLDLLMSGFGAPWAQHIIVTHLGYMRPVEETANVIANRLINNYMADPEL